MVVRVESFCGCMSLKCGALFIGIFELSLSALVIAAGAFLTMQPSYGVVAGIGFVILGGDLIY